MNTQIIMPFFETGLKQSFEERHLPKSQQEQQQCGNEVILSSYLDKCVPLTVCEPLLLKTVKRLCP